MSRHPRKLQSMRGPLGLLSLFVAQVLEFAVFWWTSPKAQGLPLQDTSTKRRSQRQLLEASLPAMLQLQRWLPNRSTCKKPWILLLVQWRLFTIVACHACAQILRDDVMGHLYLLAQCRPCPSRSPVSLEAKAMSKPRSERREGGIAFCQKPKQNTSKSAPKGRRRSAPHSPSSWAAADRREVELELLTQTPRCQERTAKGWQPK